jgi:replicative DNA helicase
MALEADCHVLLLCQLNNERNKGAKLPRPVKRDIRGTGQLANDAANVLMIAREQEEVQGAGDMWKLLPPGALYFEKARNGALGGVPVWFDERRMKYVEEEVL